MLLLIQADILGGGALEYLFVPPQKVRNIDCFNLNKSPTGAGTVKKISIIHPNHFITLFI